MGTDIHGPFVEVRESYAEPMWRLAAEMSWHQDYLLFDLLAGGRGQNKVAHVAPRGLPQDASFPVLGHATLWVGDGAVGDGDDEAVVTRERAEELVAAGSASWCGTDRITAANYHHYSWLTLAELAVILDQFQDASWGVRAHEVAATVAFMRALETPERPTRVIFWFDS